MVGVVVVALAALAVIWFAFFRDGGDAEPAATPTVTVTATPTQTASPEPTATPSPSPTETTAPEAVQLRPDGIGPLELRMTAEQALATGAVTEQQTEGLSELVADPDTYPGVFVGWDQQADSIESFTVKDGSPITTPDGIGVSSTAEDVRAAYGPLVQERTEDGVTWQVVAVDDVGYAFFPDGDGGLIMVAATDTLLAEVKPGQGLF